MSRMTSKIGDIRKPHLVLWVSGALAAMALVSLVWQELGYYRQPREPQSGLPASEKIFRNPVIPAVSLFLARPGAGSGEVTNVFHSPQVDRYLTRIEELKQAEAAARKATLERLEKAAREELARKAALEALQKKAAEKVVPKAAAVAAAVALPGIHVVYQGSIQASGAPLLAFLAVQPPGKTFSCAAGEQCAGAGITNITVDAVELILVDGSLRRLEAGKPEFIREELLHACR